MSYIGCPTLGGGNNMTYCETSCSCEGEYDAYDILEHKLMQMTHWAHKTVLFEKIKARIEQEEGQKLEKIADLLVEAIKTRKITDQEAARKDEELREKIRDAFDA